MTAFISPTQPWRAGHIDGPSNGIIDYPLTFQALVLDDGADDFSGDGTIYIDDLASTEDTLPPTAVPTSSPAIFFQADRTTLGAGGGLFELERGECQRGLPGWRARNRSGQPSSLSHCYDHLHATRCQERWRECGCAGDNYPPMMGNGVQNLPMKCSTSGDVQTPYHRQSRSGPCALFSVKGGREQPRVAHQPALRELFTTFRE